MRRLFVLLVALGILFAIELVHGTLAGSWTQLTLWVLDSTYLIFAALAAGLVISCGQLDISIGGLASLVGMLVLAGSSVMATGLAGLPLIFIIITAAIVIQSIIGLLIARTGFSALTCTLGCGFLYQGAASIVDSYIKCVGMFKGIRAGENCGSRMVDIERYPYFFQDRLFWLVIAVVCVAALTYWRKRTLWGLRHIAVGMDPRSAKVVGIVKSRIVIAAFGGSAFLIGLATLAQMFGFRGGAWEPTEGVGWLLVAIGAAVLGGCSVTGGRFDPVSIAVAAIFVRALDKVVLGFKLESEMQYVIFGGGLLIFLYSENRRERAGYKSRKIDYGTVERA